MSRLETNLRSIFFVVLLFWATGTFLAPLAAETGDGLEIGDPIPSFQLKDASGKPFDSSSLKDSEQLTLVVFVGVDCPLVKFYVERLKEIQRKFPKELRIVAVNSNSQDSLTEIAAFAKQLEIPFPVLKDVGNKVADKFGAKRTPQVFLFDQGAKLCYSGLIDDQYHYGQQRPKAESTYLLDAVTSQLAEKPVSTPVTEPIGCLIGRIRTPNSSAKITYCNQIVRLLNRHCVSCHREGEIGPFALTEYDEVAGWAEMIQEVTSERRMPPWHADPMHGSFSNDISLSSAQIELIQQWVKDGSPYGDEKELPEPPEFREGWQIGEPDFEIALADEPQVVPATGVIPYQYFVVDPGFKEDKWIQAAECRIGNRRVVHHIIVGIKGSSGKVHGQIDSEWLTATAPGAPPLVLEEGYAKLIPAGSRLVFQMHYTPCGVEQSDLSKVGFKFADPAKVKRSVGTVEVLNTRFSIPPNKDNHRVEANHTFEDDSQIISLFPHMHLRGKSFKYTAHYPDGNSEVLLNIPAFDFNWQNGYKFKKPKEIPKGTRLHCVAHFDNSKNNFANPNPNKRVRWGDQTFDEMMIGYFDMALKHQDLTKKENNPRTQTVLDRIKNGETIISDRLKKLAKSALKSEAGMKRFGAYLATRMPHLDRVCLIRRQGDRLKAVRVVQRSEFDEVVAGAEMDIPAKGMHLQSVISKGKSHVVQELVKLKQRDAKYMAEAFRSSCHVPVEFDGSSAVISFWSTEYNGFPQEIERQVQELAQLMIEN